MSVRISRRERLCNSLKRAIAATAIGTLIAAIPAGAQDTKKNHDRFFFFPGNLVVSRSVYDNNPNNVQVGEILPPNCANTQGGCSGPGGAPYNGTYPFVWNDDTYDGSFGITSKIYLDQMFPFGFVINSLEVPNSAQHGYSGGDQLVSSFSSKSELALNLSTDHQYLTFSGYVSPIDQLDVSNSNTAGAVDPTNPVGENVYRAEAQVDRFGQFQFTETNAYSGNNGRAVVWNNSNGDDFFYTSGNAGNGSNPQPDGVILGAGTQIISPANAPESQQNPGTPTPVGSFNITELGFKADKIGKDDNFRGLTIFNNVLYYSKGSGSNGVNTVYFLDTTGTACPNGVGLPSSSATLPTTPLAYNINNLQTQGLPSNMCILAGFPAIPNKEATTTAFPFGIWFANATTVYIADEGDGYTGGTDLYTHAAAQTTAGLQKWIFNSSTNTWNLAYTLQTGLGLGMPYTVRNYPTGNNVATGLPWAPAADGLRNITGAVVGGYAAIWAISSTVSGNGDTGADPNQLVLVIDSIQNTDPKVAAHESFFSIRQAGFGEVLRGVSFTPGS
jgi:flagellin-like hook-associated protein FlgL